MKTVWKVAFIIFGFLVFPISEYDAVEGSVGAENSQGICHSVREDSIACSNCLDTVGIIVGANSRVKHLDCSAVHNIAYK